MAKDSPIGDPSLQLRRNMVQEQIRTRGIDDERVLAAIMAIQRERFLPPELGHRAYDDQALPIDCGQTISQPYIVAYMTHELNAADNHRVLEVGTGSGYQTAVLAQLCGHVYTIERVEELHRRAMTVLSDLQIQNVTASVGDGTLGWPKYAPYDRILVTAAAAGVPPSLVNQLTEGGILVMPVGRDRVQTVVRVHRQGPRTIETSLLPCRFVQLIGREGWDEE